MAKTVTRFIKGILLKGETSDLTDNLEGSIWVNSTDSEMKSYLGASVRTMVSEDQAQTLTNKTIDVDNNTISNIETDNLKSGVLVTDSTFAGATDTQIPSALAVRTALEAQNEASEITYDNSTSGLTATDVQAAIDEVEGRVDTAETNIGNNATAISDHISDATAAHAASAIGNTPSGNLVATDVQGALNELQTELDSAATDADLTAHITDATDAHAASAITNTPSGNLTSTNAQDALNELQTDVDTRATSTDLTNHISDASGAHAASAISYDNTGTGMSATDVQAAIVENDGRLDTLESAGVGATTALDNLASTAVNANIVPDGNITRDLGSATNAWNDMHIQNVLGREGTRINARVSGEGNITAPTTNVAGALISPHNSAGLRRFGIFSESDATADAIQTTDLLIETGNKTAGTGNSGNIAITVGTSAGGSQGEIKLLKSGVAPTIGDVWTASATDGTGYWAAAPATGATTALDNLAAVSINADLDPDGNGTRDLGNSAANWNQIYGRTYNIFTSTGGNRGSLVAGQTTPSGATNTVALKADVVDSITVSLMTRNETVNTSGNVLLETGNVTGGSADSGDISLRTGTSAGGARGSITMEANELDASNITTGIGLPVWRKITVSHTALQTASTANDVELLSLPAAATIHAVIIKHTTAFAGTGVTGYTASIGISGDLTKYASAFDVLQATGDTVAQSTNVVDVENFGSATSIRIAATSTGANLDQSTAGSVDVYVLMSTLPV